MFSAFNPSKHTHTWSSGQPTQRRPGSSWGFGALLKGLNSVVDNSCRSRDSNLQPWITSPTLYPRLPQRRVKVLVNRLMQPIPIVACFGDFLPLLSSSAGEIHVQSDLNLEIDFGNLRLSIYLPLNSLTELAGCFGSLS